MSLKRLLNRLQRISLVGMLDPTPEVRVQFNNGDKKTIFEFYPDEISFEESDFIGLTEESARRLKFEKDKKFLQA